MIKLKYLIGYLDKVTRPKFISFGMPKMSRYVKTFKVKDEKDKNNNLMPFRIDDHIS